MRLHSILHGSRANGPSLRSVVWFQGCSIGCKGCQNPATHSFSGGLEIEPEDLAYQIVRESADGTDGITISGGEPLHQAVSLYRFLSMIRAIRPNWSLGMFTGYTLTELTIGDYMVYDALADRDGKRRLWEHQIREALHWAITGRFDASRPTLDVDYTLRPHLRMCSSLNQCLWIFHGKHTYEDFADRMCEVNIGPDGLTQISGFPAIKSTTGENA